MPKKIFSSLFILFLTLIIFEGFLRVASLFSPKIHYLTSKPDSISARLDDSKNLYRGNPEYFEHDSRGLRNASVPEKADIVVLGDSQSYGAGVPREKNWPSVLEKKIRQRVYNMSLGGWGPVQYKNFFNDAIALKPHTLIVGLYLGNDIFDAYHVVYGISGFEKYQTQDSDIRKKISEIEKVDSIASLAENITKKTSFSAPDIRVQNGSSLLGALKSYNLIHSVYSLVSPQEKGWDELKDMAEKNSEFFEILEYKNIQTILLPKYRASVENMQDVRVLEGQRILKEILGSMDAQARENGIALIVLLLPTKEHAHEYIFKKIGKNPSLSYTELIENENFILSDLMSFFKNKNIIYINALGALQEKLNEGVPLYLSSQDGHTNSQGHELIAEILEKYFIQTRLK